MTIFQLNSFFTREDKYSGEESSSNDISLEEDFLTVSPDFDNSSELSKFL